MRLRYQERRDSSVAVFADSTDREIHSTDPAANLLTHAVHSLARCARALGIAFTLHQSADEVFELMPVGGRRISAHEMNLGSIRRASIGIREAPENQESRNVIKNHGLRELPGKDSNLY